MGLLLIITNIEIKRVLNIGTRKRGKRNRVNLKNRYFDGKLDYIEKLIQKSNIRIYIPYSVWSHLLICSLLLFLGTAYMKQYINFIVAFIFGIGLSTMPFLMLQIIADIFSYKIKRISVDFLIILKNFFIANKSKDIFDCFSKTSAYVSEPLRSYIDIMVHEHKYKINPVQCLENLKDKLEISELKLFIENLKICYIHGGNIIGLIDAFIEINSIIALGNRVENSLIGAGWAGFGELDLERLSERIEGIDDAATREIYLDKVRAERIVREYIRENLKLDEDYIPKEDSYITNKSNPVIIDEIRVFNPDELPVAASNGTLITRTTIQITAQIPMDIKGVGFLYAKKTVFVDIDSFI